MGIFKLSCMKRFSAHLGLLLTVCCSHILGMVPAHDRSEALAHFALGEETVKDAYKKARLPRLPTGVENLAGSFNSGKLLKPFASTKDLVERPVQSGQYPIDFVVNATIIPEEWGTVCDIYEDPVTKKCKVLTWRKKSYGNFSLYWGLSTLATGLLTKKFVPQHMLFLTTCWSVLYPYYYSGAMEQKAREYVEFLICDLHEQAIESRVEYKYSWAEMREPESVYFLSNTADAFEVQLSESRYICFRKNNDSGDFRRDRLITQVAEGRPSACEEYHSYNLTSEKRKKDGVRGIILPNKNNDSWVEKFFHKFTLCRMFNKDVIIRHTSQKLSPQLEILIKNMIDTGTTAVDSGKGWSLELLGDNKRRKIIQNLKFCGVKEEPSYDKRKTSYFEKYSSLAGEAADMVKPALMIFGFAFGLSHLHRKSR